MCKNCATYSARPHLGSYTRTTPDPDDMDGGVTAAQVEKEADGHGTAFWMSRWKEAAGQRDARDNAAQLWKETARRAVKERDEMRDAWEGALGAVKEANARTRNACEEIDRLNAALARAEKQRDEAVYQRDQWMRGSDSWRATLDEAIEERRRIARALGLPENVTADAMATRIEEVESRLPTPDAITDEMIERGRSAYWGNDCTVEERVRAIIAAALTEPPARPEGAEEIEAVLREEWSFSDEDGGEEAFADLAGRLAQRGVRVEGGERP